jgi:hypothetical protein
MRRLATRKCAAGTVALPALVSLLGLAAPSFSLGAPVPKQTVVWKGNRVQDLTLEIRADRTTLVFGDRKKRTRLTLTNHSDHPRRVAELPVAKGWPRPSPGYSLVLRFQDGTLLEVPGMTNYGGVAAVEHQPKFEPLEVAPNGSATSEWDLTSVVSHSHQALMTYQKCKAFCVTVVAPELRLKSNTVFVNGFTPHTAEYDPFKDVAACHRKLEEELKEERRKDEEKLKRIRR